MPRISIIICCSLLLVFGCKIDSSQQTNERPVVVCSTSIIADNMQAVLGNEFDVRSLMGPGVDPHSYNPRPSDVQLLQNADVIVYNGFHLEGKMADLFHQLAESKPTFAVADYFPENQQISASKTTNVIDPHIWFTPESWLKSIGKVADQLATLYPEKAAGIKQRFELYQRKSVDEMIALKSELSTIPSEQRVLITSHDAFHYFGKYFGIEVRALQGVSTTQEPGVRDVLELVDFIVKRKIKSIFIEHSVSPKSIQAVIESCNAKGHKVNIGGTLYSDALGAKNSDGGTYIEMIRHNITTISTGLK